MHTFAAREKGTYTLAPIVISYQLTAGETPSGVIRDYFGPVDVLVKVPLSELKSKPGLKEGDIGDRVNQTRDNVKDKVGELRDDIKDKLNETKDKVKDKKTTLKDKLNDKTGTDVDDKAGDITDIADDPEDKIQDLKDNVDIRKRTSGRSMDMDEEATVEVEVTRYERSGP